MKKYIKASIADYKNDDYIMEILREREGIDANDSSQDDEILTLYDTPDDILDALCDYEGLIGYGDWIRDAIWHVYDVDLNGNL